MTRRRPATFVRALVAATVVACAAAIGLTFALWHGSAALAGGMITAGRFELTLGDASWSAQNADGSVLDGNGIDDIVMTAGQTVVVTQQLGTQMTGDNLAVTITARLANLPEEIVAMWYLADGQDVQVAPASGEVPLGQSLLVPDISVGEWKAIVALTVPDNQSVWIDPASPPEPIFVDLGALAIEADQVRCGTAFTSACPVGGAL